MADARADYFFGLAISLFVAYPQHVLGHGAMLLPPPRNAIDSTIPGNNWGNGTNKTGVLEKLGVGCANGTEHDACHPGQSVFWFSQGCTPGCERCDNNGTRMPNWDHCADTRKGHLFQTVCRSLRDAVKGPL